MLVILADAYLLGRHPAQQAGKNSVGVQVGVAWRGLAGDMIRYGVLSALRKRTATADGVWLGLAGFGSHFALCPF